MKGTIGNGDPISRLNEVLGKVFLEQYTLFQRRLSWFQLEILFRHEATLRGSEDDRHERRRMAYVLVYIPL